MILYIDPSVMSYAIQAIAGIIIAIAAFVGIYFRRAKKKINNKLGRDENKNKEVETDEIVVNDTKEEKKEEVVEEKKEKVKAAAKKTTTKNTSKKTNTKNKK